MNWNKNELGEYYLKPNNIITIRLDIIQKKKDEFIGYLSLNVRSNKNQSQSICLTEIISESTISIFIKAEIFIQDYIVNDIQKLYTAINE